MARGGTFRSTQETTIVLLLTLGALLLRLRFIPGRIMVEGDGVHYAALARNALQGDVTALLNPYWSNLWAATIAVFAWPSGDVVLAGRLASAICGAALIVPVYWIAREAMGVEAGILAGIFTAVHPWLLRFSALVYSEPLFNLLLMTAIAAAVYAVRRPAAWAWATLGGLTVLGMLTREAAGSIVLLLPVLAWLAYRQGARRGQVARCLAAFAIVLLLGVGGRYVTARIVFGNWQQAGFGLKGAANLIIGDAFYDSARLETLVRAVDSSGRTKYETLLQDGRALEYVLSDLPALGRRIGANIYHAGISSLRVLPPLPERAPALVSILLFAVAAYGLFVCWRRSAHVAAVAAGAFVLTLAPLLVFFVHDRLVLPLAPLFCLALAWGVADLVQRARLLRWLAYTALAASVFINVGWAAAASTIYSGDPVVQKEVGLWLRATQPANARLMADNPFVAYYAYDDNPYRHYDQLPLVHTPDELVAIALRKKTTVIAVPEWFTRLGGPGVTPLITPDGALPSQLQRVRVMGDSPTRVFIYRVVAASQ